MAFFSWISVWSGVFLGSDLLTNGLNDLKMILDPMLPPSILLHTPE